MLINKYMTMKGMGVDLMVLKCPHCGLPIEIEEFAQGWIIKKHGDVGVETSSISDGFLFGNLEKEGEDDGK